MEKGKINREHNLKSSFLLMENKAKARDVYNVLNDRHFDNLEDVKIIISDGGISLSIRMINFFSLEQTWIFMNTNPPTTLTCLCVVWFTVRILKQINGLKRKMRTYTRENILQEFFRTYKNEVKRIMVLDFTFERQIELAIIRMDKTANWFHRW